MNRVKINPGPRMSTDQSDTNDTIEEDDEDTSLEDEEEARARKLAPVKVLTAADIARMEWEERNVDLIKLMLKKWKRIKERTVTAGRPRKTSLKHSVKSVTPVEELEEDYEEMAEEQEEEGSERKDSDETEEHAPSLEPEFDFDDFDDEEEIEYAPVEKPSDELVSPTSSSFSDTDKEEENDSTSEVEEEFFEKEEQDDGASLAPFIAELYMDKEELLIARQKRMRGSTVLLNQGRDDILYRRESYVSARNPSTSTDTNYEIILSSSDEGKAPRRKSRLYHKLRLVGEEILVARDHRKALKNKQDQNEVKFEQKEFNEIDFSKLKGMGFFFNDESFKKKHIYDKFRVHHVKKTVDTMMEEIEGGTPEELAKRKEFERSVIVKPGLRKKMWQRKIMPHLDRYTDFIDAVEWTIEKETMPESFHESILGSEEIAPNDVTVNPTKSIGYAKKKSVSCLISESQSVERGSCQKSHKRLSRKDSIKLHLENLRKKDMKYKDNQRKSTQDRSMSEYRIGRGTEKPYHEICRDRMKQNVKEYRAMFRDELELLAKGQTFALRGVQIQRQFEVGVQKCGEILQPWTYKERQRIENLLGS